MARLTLLLISPINIISGSLIISVMPFIKKDFMHVDNIVFLSQMIFTLPFISIVLFAPLTCYLTDYFGKKKTLVATLFYIAFIGTLTGLLDNIYYILVARFFFGIGIAFLSTVFVTLIGDYYASKERNFFLGYQKSFTLLFGLIFILLGEKLASYSWKYSFFLYGLIFFAAIMSAKYIYEPSIMIKIQKEKTSYRDIVFDNKVLFLLSFLLGILLYMQPIQLPFLLHDIGLGDYVGLIVGCHFAVAILSSYIYGVLSLKMSNKTIFLFGSICKAISYGAFSFAHELEQFLMFSFFSGIGSGIIHIHLIKWLLDNLNENSRIKGLSLQVSCTNLGIFLSPIIFYPIVKSFGYQSSFLIGSALFITISFCAYMYFKDKNS